MRIDNRRNPQLAEVVKEERQERKPLNLDALELFNRVTSTRISKDQLDNAAIHFARNQEAEAKQQQTDYKNSNQRKKDWDNAVADALGRLNLTGGNLDLQIQNLPNTTQNQKEAEIDTAVQSATLQREQAEDAALMDKHMDTIRSMPQEDRNLLEQYLSGRNEWLDHKAIASSTTAYVQLCEKYGTQLVKKLAESYERYRNQLGTQQNQEQTQRQTDTGFLSGVGHSLGSIAANAIGSVTGPLGYLQEALTRTGQYQTLDPNNPGMLPGKYAAIVREEVAENIRGDGKLLGNAAALGYQAIMGAADNAARLVMGAGTPGGSLGLAAMGSFAQTVSEASAQGASPAQAVLLGVSKAGLEVITEKMSLDELLRSGKGGTKAVGEIIRNVMRQAGVEVTEEELSMLGGIVAEALILREKSGYNQKIAELVAAGMSYQDAKAQVNLGLWEEAVNTAAQSFLTGSLMEGGREIISGIGTSSNQTPAETAPEAEPTQEQPAIDPLAQFREVTDEHLRAQEQPVQEPAPVPQEQLQAEETEARGEEGNRNPEPETRQQERQEENREEARAETEDNKKLTPPADRWEKEGAVGSSQFEHKTQRSEIYSNTYTNATDEKIRDVGTRAENMDPKIAEYEAVSERESTYNADLRTRTKRERNAEYTYLTKKEGWTGEDNDTAMRILKSLQKETDGEKFLKLARAQRERGTTAGQMIQSFAKYTRRDPTKAAVDAVNDLDTMTRGDVSRKFWTGKMREQLSEGELTDQPDQPKQAQKRNAFDDWKRETIDSVLEIANEIDNVSEGDANAMRDIVRQLANFRNTTGWWGLSSNLSRNAERILKKMDFDTAKEIACAQLRMIPDDFRKRSAGEVISAIRYNNMLSSLVTINRNLGGNSATGLMDAVTDSTVGRFADWLLSTHTGKRTVGNDIRYAKEYFRAAIDAGDMASLIAELDIPTANEGKYIGKVRTFSPQGGPLSRFLSVYEKYMNYALQVTDEFFVGGTSGAVAKSLEALGEKSGLTPDEIAALGERTGNRRTFKEGRRIAKASAEVKKGMNILGVEGFGAGDLFMPFARTGAELGQVAIDYSGTGLVEGIGEIIGIIRDVNNGEEIAPERQRKAVSDFGRGVTGPMLIAAFAAMAAKGIIVVNDDPDKDKRGLEQSMNLSGTQLNLSAAYRGLQGMSTELQDDDLVVSLDFLQPFNSQMLIGYLISQEETAKDTIHAYPGATLQGIAQSMVDMPLMNTIADIADLGKSFGEVSEGDFSAVSDAAGQLIGNQASGFIPAWMRQTAQYIDPVYRDTTGETALEKSVNQVKSSVPWLSKTLPAKYTGLGEIQTRYDDPVTGFFNTFVLPGTMKRVKTNEIAEKLDDLGDVNVYPDYLAPKSFTVDGKTVMVSGKEMTETYQKTYGDNVTKFYGGLMDAEDFNALPKDLQIDALKKAKSYAVKFAKAAVSDYDDVPNGTPEELVQNIIRDVAKNEITGAFEEVTNGWKETFADDSGALEDLEAAYQAYSGLSADAKRAVDEGLSGKLLAYVQAREAGQSPEELMSRLKVDTLVDAGMDNMAEFIREGTNSGYAATLEQAYQDFKSLSKDEQEMILKNASGRNKYYLTAREAGVDTETFTDLYGKFLGIQDREDLGETDQAIEWAYTLEKAVEAGQISREQADVLEDRMKIFNTIPVGAGKYDSIVDAGFDADTSLEILQNMRSIQGTGKDGAVKTIDEYNAILSMDFLSEEEQDAVMKLYMTDYNPDAASPVTTELKYEYARQEMGLSVREYIDAWNATQEYSKKADIQKAWIAMGFTQQQATMLWNLFKATGYAKIDVVEWWNERSSDE